jgi:hypothetical protein
LGPLKLPEVEKVITSACSKGLLILFVAINAMLLETLATKADLLLLQIFFNLFQSTSLVLDADPPKIT